MPTVNKSTRANIVSVFSVSKPIRIATAYVTALRLCVHCLSALWLALVYYWALSGELEGDPVQHLLDFSGKGALNLLILSLLISPLARHLKFAQLMRVRKTLGVYAAVYALFHFYVFTAYELQYEWLLIASEIIERPYITVGMLAVIILSLLLVSSLDTVKNKMGPRWQQLHNFSYLALIAACIHYLWSVKSDWLEPATYIAISLFLLVLRKQKFQKMFK